MSRGPSTGPVRRPARLGRALCFAAALAGFAVVIPARAADAASAPAAPPAGATLPEVVARVNGSAVTREAVVQRTAAAIARLREQERGLVEAAVNALVDDALLAEAAQKENKPPGSWLADAIEKRVRPPGDDAVRAFYDAHAAGFGGRTLEAVRAQIVEQLMGDERRRAESELKRQLRAQAKVELLLEPARVAAGTGAYPPKGAADAPVTIVEFGDFECPFTRRAEPLLQRLEKSYGALVRFAWREFPAPYHALARPAALASACAGRQRKFWPLHDALLAAPRAALENLTGLARAADLEGAAFGACLADPSTAAAIDADVAEARALGATTPPALFVNGRPLTTSATYEDLARLVDDELARLGIKRP